MFTLVTNSILFHVLLRPSTHWLVLVMWHCYRSEQTLVQNVAKSCGVLLALPGTLTLTCCVCEVHSTPSKALAYHSSSLCVFSKAREMFMRSVEITPKMKIWVCAVSETGGLHVGVCDTTKTDWLTLPNMGCTVCIHMHTHIYIYIHLYICIYRCYVSSDQMWISLWHVLIVYKSVWCQLVNKIFFNKPTFIGHHLLLLPQI